MAVRRGGERPSTRPRRSLQTAVGPARRTLAAAASPRTDGTDRRATADCTTVSAASSRRRHCGPSCSRWRESVGSRSRHRRCLGVRVCGTSRCYPNGWLWWAARLSAHLGLPAPWPALQTPLCPFRSDNAGIQIDSSGPPCAPPSFLNHPRSTPPLPALPRRCAPREATGVTALASSLLEPTLWRVGWRSEF